VIVGFRLPVFEQEELIRNMLAPLATFGQISSHTFLRDVGKNYDQELAYKKLELPDRYLFGPMSSFRQEAVRSSGETTTKESQGQKGRTPDVENPDQMMKANVEDYQAAILWAYRDVKEAKTKEDREKAIAAFIAALMMANVSFMREAYSRGYFEAGGVEEPNEDRIDAVALWNNGYAENFRKDMLHAIAIGEEPFPDFEQRASLYAPEGWRRAWMAGTWQAKKEQGITGWQRVLHPESSQSGPCEACIADSTTIHSIDEEFFDHNFGVCEARYITFYRGPTSVMPMRVPALEYPVPRVSGR